MAGASEPTEVLYHDPSPTADDTALHPTTAAAPPTSFNTTTGCPSLLLSLAYEVFEVSHPLPYIYMVDKRGVID